jgi:ubiquinone/menaquinone biosynthesis C-methylase UbiE
VFQPPAQRKDAKTQRRKETQRTDGWAKDYTAITELPGSLLNREQFGRFVHRYALAGEQARSGRLLEVACGAGSGLGFVQQHARQVVGLDYTEAVLRLAQAHYGARIPLVRGDAQTIPFAAAAFDLILCFEAIYYLPDYRRFLTESRRVLAPGGTLLLCQSNPDWPDFVPGPLTTHYPSAPELASALAQAGFHNIQLFGALPTTSATPQQLLIHRLRRLVLSSGLLPSEGPAAALLKRLTYGQLTPLPVELDIATTATDRFKLSIDRLDSTVLNRTHRVLYAFGEA